MSGTLTLSGTPTFQWDGVTQNGKKTFLSAGSFASGTADVLAGAKVTNIPSSRCRASVTVAGNAVEVRVGIPGMVVVFR